MKKLFAALMSLCLMLSAFAAFAETPATTTVNWSDYEAEAAKVEGQFAEVGNTGLKMFIPAEFKDTELSEETLAEGIFMVLKPENEKAVINAQVVPMDYETFKAAATEKAVTAQNIVLNGINFFEFAVQTDGVTASNFMLPTEENTALVFSFTPVDPVYNDILTMMAASLQAAE